MQARIRALLLSVDGLWNEVLQTADLVADAARVVFASPAGSLQLRNDGFDFGKCGVEALGALLLGALELLGILGELIEERKCLFKGGIDGGLILL